MNGADMISAPLLPTQTVPAPRVNPTGTAKEIRAAAEDFESFFLSQMFEYMFCKYMGNNSFILKYALPVVWICNV